MAAIVAVAVNSDGRREIIGLGLGPSQAETFWVKFLRSLKGRGLDDVKLVILNAHTGLKTAISRVFDATWQRCRVGLLKKAPQRPRSLSRRQASAAYAVQYEDGVECRRAALWRTGKLEAHGADGR